MHKKYAASGKCAVIRPLSDMFGIELIKKWQKIWQIHMGGGIICVDIFYLLILYRWKNKILTQKNQREVFGEWLLTFLHDLSSLLELQSEFMDDMA